MCCSGPACVMQSTTDLADNYLELVKKRLYEGPQGAAEAARYTLYQTLLGTIRLLAPIMPHVTDQIYRDLFASDALPRSIHSGPWPVARASWRDDAAAEHGQSLLAIATAVRRYKSDNNLSLGSELPGLHVVARDSALAAALQGAATDIASVTRAARVTVDGVGRQGLLPVHSDESISVSIALAV
jgi:valyl-tRNA synthetase